MTGTTSSTPSTRTYHCTACGHLPSDAPRSAGALRHCEVCGSWVAAPTTALCRDLELPLVAGVPV